MGKDGAKNRMARLQGRKPSECATCGDDMGVSTCPTCGETFCRDCRMDHECLEDSSKSTSATRSSVSKSSSTPARNGKSNTVS